MKKVYDREVMALKAQMVDLPWEDKDFYISFLTQTYYFVRHSTRLLAVASGLAPLGEDSLHRRFAEHIAEEKGHDKMALGDLKRMGVTELASEHPATRNLYEGQYFKVEHQHPAALFGYILALEGIASLICPEIAPRVYQTHGLPSSTFLKLHVEEDPGHVEKAFQEIENLQGPTRALALDNMLQSLWSYSVFLSECEKNARQSQSTEATMALN